MKNFDSQYHWMMINFPHWIMYKHVYIDSQHRLWLPRWGCSKQQLEDAKLKSEERFKNIFIE